MVRPHSRQRCPTPRISASAKCRLPTSSGARARLFTRWRRSVADIRADLLARGRARAEERGLSGRVEFVEANAEALPFTERRFDAVTIAFGSRTRPPTEAA